ncbi:MAG TPA: SEC-C metal-binding domain-containing protein [Acidobacteriota bacterium]|nr:SEC-C metal-binding domain-containing protein [Acidobacteriota bacterium]
MTGPEAEPEADGLLQDLSSMDLDRINLDELVKSLPPGMKLPPGMGLKQLKDLISSPQAKMASDFLLFCREKGVEINEGKINAARTGELQDEWKSTPREAFDGRTPDEMLAENPGLMPGKVETVRREEPRVGRNDPCPCGSGKKYKKCCGNT